MRYTLDENGYLNAVFFGCYGENCNGWEGEIPDDLEENLGAYRFGRGGNLLKTVGFKQKCILSSNGEEIENQDANLVVTDYIELMENREYIYKNVATSGLYGAFYDEEYNLKNAFLIDSGSNEVELTIPEGARYVRFTADLSNNKYCLGKINIGDDLSDKTLYGYNFEQVTGRTDDAPTSEYKHILIQTDNYYLLAYNNGSDKRYIQVYDKRDASPTYSRPKIYDANENINEFPSTLPADFGVVNELKTINPYYDFLFIDNPEEETVFTFFSTNELILDEAKLEELEELKEALYDPLGVVLYNNESGSNGTIELKDSAENYTYIEIFYKTNDSEPPFGSVKIHLPNGKMAQMDGTYPYGGGTFYAKSTIAEISETSIIPKVYSELSLNSNGRITVDNINNIYITRVIGYK